MTDFTCVYGAPSPALANAPADALQTSPLFPSSAALEDLAPESLAAALIAAPPGTLERRYVLALALRALKPGGALTALAPNDKGGARLRGELETFGCKVEESGRSHHRICHVVRPTALTAVDTALASGGLQLVGGMGLWSQPGVFSWDRPDPGTALLIETLPPLSGGGADLGCGVGSLALKVLAGAKIARLALIDIDRRAIAAARLNVDDPRASFHWADARAGLPLSELDFVVANPPFHDGASEDRTLGQVFIRRAHQVLRKGGVAWIVANRHLPYEAVLAELFSAVAVKVEARGFKVFEARR